MRYDPKQVFTSPAGPASFPNLIKPRQFKNKGDFAYDTGLILSDSVFTTEKLRGADMPFRDAIETWGALSAEKHRTDPRALPYGPLMEKDSDGNRIPVPGLTVVKLKVDATTETRKGDIWDRKPKLFDANGAPITTPVQIVGGTIIRVKFQVWLTNGGDPKRCGVKLQPVSVQICKEVDNAESFERYESGEDSFDPSHEALNTPCFIGDVAPKGDF